MGYITSSRFILDDTRKSCRIIDTEILLLYILPKVGKEYFRSSDWFYQAEYPGKEILDAIEISKLRERYDISSFASLEDIEPVVLPLLDSSFQDGWDAAELILNRTVPSHNTYIGRVLSDFNLTPEQRFELILDKRETDRSIESINEPDFPQ